MHTRRNNQCYFFWNSLMEAVKELKGKNSIPKRSLKSLFRLLTDFFTSDHFLFFQFDEKYDMHRKVLDIFMFNRYIFLLRIYEYGSKFLYNLIMHFFTKQLYIP